TKLVTDQQVAARAYEIFLSRGDGKEYHDRDWLEAERELRPLTVVIVDVGENKIGLIKQLRTITGMDLARAKEVMDSDSKIVKQGMTRAEAEEIRAQLTALGASVEIRGG